MGGGGGMVRAFGRGVGGRVGAVQEAFSATTTVLNNKPITSLRIAPTSTTSATLPSSSCSYSSDFDEWDHHGEQHEIPNRFYNKFVFGPVPSKDEVDVAISALQKVFVPSSYSELFKDGSASSSSFKNTASTNGSELERITPAQNVYDPRTLQSNGSQRVYDAFHLLRTEPSVQRMVTSLSTDRAVWNAVMNNNAVRELRDTFYTAESSGGGSSGEGSDPAMRILRWILDNTKSKIVELIAKMTRLLSEAFQHAERGTAPTVSTDLLEDALKSSFLLSVVIFLLVIVTRAHRI